MLQSLKVILLAIVLPALVVVAAKEATEEEKEWARQLCNATKEEIQRANPEDPRIVGGEFVNGIIEYQLLLQAKYPNSNNGLQCGGAAINLYHVLTAAHCVKDGNGVLLTDVNIFGGVHRISPYYLGTWQKRKASHVLVHPQYDRVKHVNDIAILKVNDPFNFYEGTIKPVHLPTKSTPIEGEAWISGFGCTNTDIKNCRPNDQLKKANVPLWSQEKCIAAWKNAQDFYNDSGNTIEYWRKEFEKIICAGGKHTGSCSGDSGGPLVVMENDKPVVVGITSFTYSLMCGCDNVPSAYAKVLSYLDWINENSKSSSSRQYYLTKFALWITSLLTYFMYGTSLIIVIN